MSENTKSWGRSGVDSYSWEYKLVKITLEGKLTVSGKAENVSWSHKAAILPLKISWEKPLHIHTSSSLFKMFVVIKIIYKNLKAT